MDIFIFPFIDEGKS